MIDLAKKKINLKKLKKDGVNISFKTLDILKIKKNLKIRFIFIYFTFSFHKPAKQRKVMRRIYKSLNPGGVYIGRKIRSSDLNLKIF